MEQSSKFPINKGHPVRIPFHTAILLAAFMSFLLSISVWFFADKDAGLFVGIWVPSILSLGAFLEARR